MFGCLKVLRILISFSNEVFKYGGKFKETYLTARFLER